MSSQGTNSSSSLQSPSDSTNTANYDRNQQQSNNLSSSSISNFTNTINDDRNQQQSNTNYSSSLYHHTSTTSHNSHQMESGYNNLSSQSSPSSIYFTEQQTLEILEMRRQFPFSRMGDVLKMDEFQHYGVVELYNYNKKNKNNIQDK